MISTEHHKHPKLTRPALGKFGRNEWAFVGTRCEQIQALSRYLIDALQSTVSCAYVDARHAAADQSATPPGMLGFGAVSEYTDLIHAHQIQARSSWNPFQFRQLFYHADLILVNGNHHVASRQVVIIDETKADSLKRRIHQLTNVRLFIQKDPNVPVFDFLKDAIPDWQKIPLLPMEDLPGLLQFFEQALQSNKPVLNGLVLAGGKSSRMGQDKGALQWHGMPQRNYMAQLLKPFCDEVFISVRAEQESELGTAFPLLTDTFLELGPMGAIMSAFRKYPDHAWLVVACDLPLLDQATLEVLTQARQPMRHATAFLSPQNQMPEPLVAIWEPKSYAQLLSFLAQGYSCPRKVLMNTDCSFVEAPQPAALTNVNTPEEFEKVKVQLQELQQGLDRQEPK